MITQVHPGCAAVQENRDLPHVLFVVDQLGRSLGGGERVALKTAALLPRLGYRASILTFYVHPESAALLYPEIPIYLLPLQRTYDVQALRAAVALGKFLHLHDIEIVQTFFESSDLWAAPLARALSDAKVIWSRRDMGILRTAKHEYAYRFLADMPDVVFAVSEQVRRHCIQVDGIPAERVRTIYNGLDLNEWRRRAWTSTGGNRIWVTTVGNIRPVKGHDILIRGAALVASEHPEVGFKIVGDVLDTSYFESLKDLVRELDLEDKFVFAGGSTTVREQLAQSDIFVLPSRSEGFSNAIVEAMATGLPVVATDVGGNREAVEDRLSGFLIPPDDPIALASVLNRLLASRELRMQMGLRGREIVQQRFSDEVMMKNTVAVYDRLLGAS